MANCYFLVLSVLSCLPFSPANPAANIGPLCMVLIAQANALVAPQPGAAAHLPRLERRAEQASVRSGELARLRGGESPRTASLCSPQAIAGAQCFLEAANFALTYLSPDTMVASASVLEALHQLQYGLREH